MRGQETLNPRAVYEVVAPLSCDYCSDDIIDKKLEDRGKKFCSKQCMERFFARKKPAKFRSISSV